jgi:hypothetical protein
MLPTIRQVSQQWEITPETVTPVSITAKISSLRRSLPIYGSLVYRLVMPRTDENGRQLKALLDYLLDGDVEAKDIYDALGISSSTYYRRIKETDYPDAEELRRVADRFDLSYPDLQIKFGLMSRQEVWSYVESSDSGPYTVTAVREATTTRTPKLSELKPRSDAPPL